MLSVTATTNDSLIKPTTQLRFFDGVLQQKYVNTRTNEEEWFDVEVVVSAKEQVSSKLPPVFNLPPVVQKKVSLEEFLGMLRERINKNYMPSATGIVKHNSKPEYTTKVISGAATNLDIIYTVPDVSIMGSSGYITPSMSNNMPIYAWLDLKEVQLLVNLKTDSVFLKLPSEKEFSKWPRDPSYLLAVDRIELTKAIDVFL